MFGNCCPYGWGSWQKDTLLTGGRKPPGGSCGSLSRCLDPLGEGAGRRTHSWLGAASPREEAVGLSATSPHSWGLIIIIIAWFCCSLCCVDTWGTFNECGCAHTSKLCWALTRARLGEGVSSHPCLQRCFSSAHGWAYTSKLCWALTRARLGEGCVHIHACWGTWVVCKGVHTLPSLAEPWRGQGWERGWVCICALEVSWLEVCFGNMLIILCACFLNLSNTLLLSLLSQVQWSFPSIVMESPCQGPWSVSGPL